MPESKRKTSAVLTRLPVDIREVVRAAHDKKASNVVVLDLRPAAAFTDYFVICSGQHGRQVRAIVDAVDAALRKTQVRPAYVEGYEATGWVLLDYFDFVVHVFTPETRAFYGLERLWGSAERIEISDEALRDAESGKGA